MRKLLGISLIAVFAVSPVVAGAAVTDADPGQTVSNAPTASNPPKYGLAAADATDSNVATAGYVKGAYNAAIKAINKVSENTVNAATKEGTVATVNKAKASGNVSGTLSGATVTGSVTGAATGTINVMDTWGSTESSEIEISTNLSGATVSGTASGGTVSGSFSNATVTVEGYYENAEDAVPETFTNNNNDVL